MSRSNSSWLIAISFRKKEREIHANLFSFKSDRYRFESKKRGEKLFLYISDCAACM
jgi:hypothetical protein